MAYTFTGGADHRIETAYTSHATDRTYSSWIYYTGSGANLGRVWDKRDGGAEAELHYTDIANSRLLYQSNRSTASGLWYITLPSTNTWFNIVVTYNNSSNTNDPVIYQNGVSQTVTEFSTPDGTLVTNADKYVIGNRGDGSTANRNFAGYVSEVAIWDRILSTGEIASLGKGYSAAFFKSSLAFYAPLIRGAIDYKGTGALTVTSATVVAHPRIIYPTGGL